MYVRASSLRFCRGANPLLKPCFSEDVHGKPSFTPKVRLSPLVLLASSTICIEIKTARPRSVPIGTLRARLSQQERKDRLRDEVREEVQSWSRTEAAKRQAQVQRIFFSSRPRLANPQMQSRYSGVARTSGVLMGRPHPVFEKKPSVCDAFTRKMLSVY